MEVVFVGRGNGSDLCWGKWKRSLLGDMEVVFVGGNGSGLCWGGDGSGLCWGNGSGLCWGGEWSLLGDIFSDGRGGGGGGVTHKHGVKTSVVFCKVILHEGYLPSERSH